MKNPKIRVAVLTVSDRSARGERKDLGGPALAAAAQAQGWEVWEAAVVEDDAAKIARRLSSWCDRDDAPDLALTTGGTGIGPRDVTPEATRKILDKEIPGIAERMRREGEKSTPFAALSRAVCGSRKRSLILNLPGSPSGARESFEAVAALIAHALKTLRGGGHE